MLVSPSTRILGGTFIRASSRRAWLSRWSQELYQSERELTPVLTKFPDVSLAIGYGSGVIPQYDRVLPFCLKDEGVRKKGMVDLIFVVDDPVAW